MNINSTLLFFFLFTILLHYGKFILLPLFLALFIFIVIKSLSNQLLLFSNKHLKINFHEVFAMLFMFITIFTIFYFFWIILKLNITQVINNSIMYQKNLELILQMFLKSPVGNFIPTENLFGSLNLLSIFSKVLNNLTSFAGNFSFIIIFLIFFIIEEKYFLRKVNIIFKKKNVQIFKKINSDIFYYFKLKTLTSFLTGLLTFIVLYLLNNNLAPTFGVLSFLLNFIPVIGSLLAIIIPTLFSLIQFLNIPEPTITLLLLTLTQIFIGNILEPKLMGNTLNISPIVMIIFLSIMGKIWGIAGMFLSVPILVVISITLSRFKQTKKFSILLSDKGSS